MTDQTLYYLALNGAAQGPFSGDTVTSMFRSGTVPLDTLTCPVGGAAWLPLHQFPALIAPPAPPPPPTPPPVTPPPLAPFPPVAAAVPLPAPPATGYGSPVPVGPPGEPNPSPEVGAATTAPRFHVPRSHQAPPEPDATITPRDATKGFRISAILAALVCFFLPWLEFQCDSPLGKKRLLTQTGLQTVLNKATVDEELVREINGMAASYGERLPGDMQDDKMMDEAGPAWLAAVAMFMAVLALIAAFGHDGRASSGLFAALAAGILVFLAATGFPVEDAIKRGMNRGRSGAPPNTAKQAAAEKMFKVVYTPWFYVTTGALAAAAVLGLTGNSSPARRR